MPEIEPGDRVITPTDEVAKVLHVRPGPVPELELEYVDALNPATSTLSIRASLCVRWPHERPRPLPLKRRF